MHKFDFENMQATSDWLTFVLAKNGFLSKGSVSSIEQETLTVGNTGSMADFISLNVKYSQNRWDRLPSKILMKVMKLEIHTEKEIDYYEFFLNTKPSFSMIQCYGVEKSPETKQSCLLLEDLRHTHHHSRWPLPPTEDECLDAVTVLAGFHAYWWNHSCFGEPGFEIPSKEGLQKSVKQFEEAYLHFIDFIGDRLSAKRKKIYELVLRKLPELIWNRLSSSERLTLCHGDSHFSNFLYPNQKGKDECVILDWEFWTIGLGAQDLAYMMALHWYPERRQRMEQSMLKVYLEEMEKQGIDYDWEDLQTDYRIFVVFNLMTPVMQYLNGVPSFIWWDHIERVFASFEDLDCMEFL